MSWDHALSVAGIIIPVLGLPSIYAAMRWGKRQVTVAFRHSVVEVVEERVPGLIREEVAPLVDQIGALAEWRDHVTHELTPNSGSSMKDKLDAMYDVVVDLKDAAEIQRKMVTAQEAGVDPDSDAWRGQFT